MSTFETILSESPQRSSVFEILIFEHCLSARSAEQGEFRDECARANYKNRTLPRRLLNSAYRQREYLTESEVEKLRDAARKRGRNGARDSAAILLAYRQGLRAAELCQLRWAQVDLKHGRLHVNRAKGGIESVHPLHGPELRQRYSEDRSGPQSWRGHGLAVEGGMTCKTRASVKSSASMSACLHCGSSAAVSSIGFTAFRDWQSARQDRQSAVAISNPRSA